MSKIDFDPALLAEFLAESLEGIEELSHLIIQLEDNPGNDQVINSLFRPIHSLKGNAAYFGLLKIKALAHDLESLLDAMRSKRIIIDSDIIDILIHGVDELQEMLLRVRGEGPEVVEEQKFQELISRVKLAGENSQTQLDALWSNIDDRLNELKVTCESKNCKGSSAIDELKVLIQKAHPHKKKPDRTQGKQNQPRAVDQLRQLLATKIDKYMPEHVSDAISLLMNEILDLAGDEKSVSIINKMMDDYSIMVSTVGFDSLLQELLTESLDQLISLGTWKQTEKPRNSSGDDDFGEKGSVSTDSSIHKKTLRIEEERIDTFLAYVGELIVVREMFEHLRKRLRESGTEHSILTEFRHVNDSFNTLSQNLQNTIMTIRKVSVKGLCNKIPRIVRDIATAKNKKIRTEIVGDTVEIDKSLIETLEAPLVHMVRNAADHGIEPPEEREKNGKNQEGKVVVLFKEDAENVILSIKDDGAGLNLDALKSKAVSLGLVDSSSMLTEKNIVDLLFMSGVSTAEKITDISGRGVGMDVVKQNIEAAGGTISVKTQTGKGSEFIITLPKEVGTQIIMGMTIAVGEEEYIIPLECIIETFNILESDMIDISGKGKCVRRRGYLLKLLELDNILGIMNNPEDSRRIIVSVKNKHSNFGLAVHDVRAIQQVVLKQIEGLKESSNLFSGAAIAGNGRIAMVLDLDQLILSNKKVDVNRNI